ncbi:DUF4167 domain-containing protein [Sphingomonas sp. LR55]|uniref:DUF4167 domain-containing protein n=1 Tax=Sphingomonas sp. LR55 TaxID=3050231 RepID=UPI002FE3C70B
MINNRQAGRRRGRGNNNNGGGGGGGGQRQGGGGGQGGRDTGNRIDSRARGNASQLYEKYKNLARDAQQQGDRVNIEYYLQFADHYFRVLSETRARFEESQPQAQQQPRRQQPFDLDGDDDYGDEGEPIRSGEQQGQQASAEQQNGGQNGQYQNASRQNRDTQTREDRPQRDDRPQREERPRYENTRYEGQRNEGQRNEGQSRNEGQREDRVRGEGQRNQRNAPRDTQQRDERSGEEQGQAREAQARENQARETQPRDEQVREPRSDYRDAPQRETIRRTLRTSVQVANANQDSEADAVRSVTEASEQVAQPIETVETTTPVAAATEEQPRRRGRPRRDRSLDAPVATEDAAPTAFDADRLPPSLGISAITPAPATEATATDAAPEEKPRRRRVRAVPDEVAG